jgi:hypothetical protein
MRVENLTALARRFRGPAPQRLRSVLTSGRAHLRKRPLYVEESVLSKLSRY